MTQEETKKTLLGYRETIGDCKRCRLEENRRNIVLGRGDLEAYLLFVGEGPGDNEDQKGEAFVGRAGDILNRALREAKFFDGDNQLIHYFIDNMVRCRPPLNRKPEPDELQACWPWLTGVFDLMPNLKVIIPLGDTALQGLAQKLSFKKKIGTKKITELIGRVFPLESGLVIVPAFHPSYIARRPDMIPNYENFFQFIRVSLPNWLKTRGRKSA